MSAFVPDDPPAWSRWYFILIAAVAAIGISILMTSLKQSISRNFYMPTESMEPTLMKNEHFVASMRPPAGLHRGDLVLVKAPAGAIYVKRVAGLPGDRISLVNGLAIVNGQAAALQPVDVRRISYANVRETQARVYREKLPGEAGSHSIQDMGQSTEDDVDEVRIPAGNVYVLGDNRDDSADSRVPREAGGLEFVPIDEVIGRPLFLYWPWSRFGVSLHPEGLK